MKIFLSYSEPDESNAKSLKDYLEDKVIPNAINANSFSRLDSKLPTPEENPYINSLFFSLKSKASEPEKSKSHLEFLFPKLEATVYSFIHTPAIPGTHFPTQILEKIKEADFIVVLWSKSSFFSIWVDHELEYALKLKKIIIPVVMDATASLPSKLAGTQAVIAHKEIFWVWKVKNTIAMLSRFGHKTSEDVKESFKRLYYDSNYTNILPKDFLNSYLKKFFGFTI